MSIYKFKGDITIISYIYNNAHDNQLIKLIKAIKKKKPPFLSPMKDYQ